MKRIGFLGRDSADIVLYLARLLRAEGQSVQILDFTEQLSLLRCIMIPEEEWYEENEYKMIFVTAAFQENIKEKTDIVCNDIICKRLRLSEINAYQRLRLEDILRRWQSKNQYL